MRLNPYIYIIVFLFAAHISAIAQSKGGGFTRKNAVANLSSAQSELPDSLLIADSAMIKSKPIIAYRLAGVGEPYIAQMDTERMNYGNSTLAEAQSLAVGYLGNLGSPAQTKIFYDRKESRDFVYAEPYDYYITGYEKALFYDTKTPYTEVIYSQAGSGINREDRLKGLLTWNFGKKINLGAEADYIYGRGMYQSNGTKLLGYRFFGSYRSDRYELNGHIYNFNFVNFENGGLTNDRYISNPEDFVVGRQQIPRDEYPVRFANVWNRVRGRQYLITHRYNLGFTRAVEKQEGEELIRQEIFVPVSSIVHTFSYEDYFRRFISTLAPDAIDNAYLRPSNPEEEYNPDRRRLNYVYGIGESLNDVSSSWQASNTLGLAMREGFREWAKFGLTAFARVENRGFKLPARIPGLRYDELNGSGANPQPDYLDYDPYEVRNEFSTYLGADLRKRQGSILTYDAHGELCMAGDDLGEFRLDGQLRTAFPVFGREASVSASGYIRNVTPPFFQRYHRSRYFWWDPISRPLGKVRRMRVQGQAHWEYTNTTVAAGVENIQNYVYFNPQSLPEQYADNIQVLFARLSQNFYHRSFGWENEVVYQLSSHPGILPLPQVSAFSNLYIKFRLAGVLSMQMGANAYYHTLYYAPYYEPATQQFVLQEEKAVGHYPLINAYVNFHLKQARFFAMLYNAGAAFIGDPAYFSLSHYPLNPMVLKLGVAVTFKN